MSKFQKLVERLLKKPTDFEYSEARTILLHLGFEELSKGRTSGSRVEFVKDDKSILMHKPHPSGILKQYQIAQLIDVLTELELI
ncbi:MAG: type II toxin-antitoxin system HicA family toxin [Bacteroides sp.]|nr:type II toxin-antitoxin system HicA family toxin [Bacteroidales bacterium]MBD5326433.1 type II toxin-antitoxin system HicA family toxin [Bacteroides sp.]MBD5327379.1 type II toxin-antitoxin system HicA family toxin [Bacteroides sp.]